MKLQKFQKLLMFSILSLSLASCEDENYSTLPALNQPGELCVVSHCFVNGMLVPMDEAECAENSGSFEQIVYAANMATSSVAYIPYSASSKEFKAIDTTISVPGVTSIPVADRPQSMSTDPKGIFVVITSSIQNEMSIIFTGSNREIAFQKMDKTPRKIVFREEDESFYAFFSDGTIRRMTIDYKCPNSENDNEYPSGCILTKDDIRITWHNAMSLDGIIVDYVDHPLLPVGYVSYINHRYISVIGYDESAGTCLDGNAYPCEIGRLGAGFGCSDGIDNDGNGKIDSEDPSCFYPWSAEGDATDVADQKVGWIGHGACSDFIDNNENGMIDALDPGCVSSNDASEDEGFQPMTLGTCADGLDNDGDGNIDRDDQKCRWPTDDEDASNGSYALGFGQCRDGVDNDQDGHLDGEDLACYGSNGLSESEMVSTGRGALAVDEKGRWLYVIDPTDSQLIVIDLETNKTIDRSGWFPRNRVVGIPVSRLALDVESYIREQVIYDKNNHKVTSERAVVYVSSTAGFVTELTVHEKLSYYYNGELVNEVEELVLRPTDNDTDSSYVGSVRCVGRICSDSDLPEVSLRIRPAVAYFEDVSKLSDTYPTTGELYGVIYDTVIASETWRLTYEGTLELDARYDGYFNADGKFSSGVDFCSLGVQKGDHLVLRNRKGLIAVSHPDCQAFQMQSDGSQPALEWVVTDDIGVNTLTLEPTGKDGDVKKAPVPECFATGLEFEVRASDQWLVTSKSTYVNRRLTIGGRCVDNPLNPYGQTRFSFDPSKTEDINASVNSQNAFFAIKMPVVPRTYVRDDGFEFTTRSGHGSLSIEAGAAPMDLKVFRQGGSHFLLISDASANSVIVYDIDDEGVDDML